ncbi:hypothetical protein L9F63_012591, partial [Diploptera punctata]
ITFCSSPRSISAMAAIQPESLNCVYHLRMDLPSGGSLSYLSTPFSFTALLLTPCGSIDKFAIAALQ